MPGPTPQPTELAGKFLINGELHSVRLKVLMGTVAGWLEICPLSGPKCWLSLYPYNDSMRTAGTGITPRPLEYFFEGTRLGHVTQNFGDMREPDYYNRIVRKIYLKVAHTRNSIDYYLKGNAIIPSDPAYHHLHHLSNPQGDWEFECSFSVPSSLVEEVLGLIPAGAEYVRNALAKL